jgi:HTH-type transcriptional regulator/antitoxin HigA
LIRPIKNDDDLAVALARFDELFGIPDDHPDHDEYLILADLIAAYEHRAHRLPTITGRELLAYLIEINGLTQGQVPEIGAQSVVSAVLSGKRQLNLRQVRALCQRFKLSPEALV